MTATTIRRLEWHDHEGREIAFALHGSLTQTGTPVLFLPGHQLPLDWAFYPYLLAKIAEQRPVLIARPRIIGDQNEGNTSAAGTPSAGMSEQLTDAEALIETIARGRLPEGAAWTPGKLGILAHGTGSGLALLLAAGQPAIAGVLAIATVCTFNRQGGDVDARLRSDVAEHGVRFQLELAARQVRCPIVLVHGEEDQVAPFDEGERIYHWLPKEKSSLVLLEKTGHSLGADDPFAGTNKELDRVVRISREFFEREL